MSFLFRFLRKLIPGGKSDSVMSLEEDEKVKKSGDSEKSITSTQNIAEPAKKILEEKSVKLIDTKPATKTDKENQDKIVLNKERSSTKNETTSDLGKKTNIEDKPEKKPKIKIDKGKDPYGHEFVTKLYDWQKNSRTGFSTSLGQRIIPIDGVDSTNDYISQYPFLPSGTIVVARRQAKGKGQKDRKWISNVGGLYFSFKLAFPQETEFSQSKIFWIQSALSLSTCKALKNAGLNPTLKWPNDILVSGKKIGGILGESKIGNQGMVIYLGLGLNIENNLNEIITEFPELKGKISSVKEELILLGKHPSDDFLTINIFRDIIFYLDVYWNSNFPLDTLRKEWLSFSNIINKFIKFKDLENHSFEATVNDITEYGSLLVTTNNEEKKELTVGEIEFL